MERGDYVLINCSNPTIKLWKTRRNENDRSIRLQHHSTFSWKHVLKTDSILPQRSSLPEEERERERESEVVNTGQFILLSKPTRCNVIQYSLLLSTLYMFQAVSPPVIRSSKTVHTASGIWQACLLLPSLAYTRCCVYSFWAPDTLRRKSLNHVERWQ